MIKIAFNKLSYSESGLRLILLIEEFGSKLVYWKLFMNIEEYDLIWLSIPDNIEVKYNKSYITYNIEKSPKIFRKLVTKDISLKEEYNANLNIITKYHTVHPHL